MRQDGITVASSTQYLTYLTSLIGLQIKKSYRETSLKNLDTFNGGKSTKNSKRVL